MSHESRFDFVGDPGLEPRVTAALERVIDPEMALNIVSLGLVQRVEATADCVRAQVTMTSAACPVADHILDEMRSELEAEFPGAQIETELGWDPPWSPERMSAAARAAMGWE